MTTDLNILVLMPVLIVVSVFLYLFLTHGKKY